MNVKDRGVVGAFAFDSSIAYNDPDGNVAHTIAVTTAYQACPVTPNVGRSARALLTVQGTIVGGGVTTWTFYARQRKVESPLPGGVASGIGWNPTEIALVRLDGSKVAAVENSVAAGDFVGKDGNPCAVGFGTTSESLGGDLEILVKADHAPVSGDTLAITVDVAS